MANLEALWVAGKLHPGKKIAASQQAHYTHSRISEVLGLPFEAIPVDGRARMDMGALEAALQTRRDRHGGGDDGHDRDRIGRSAGGGAGAASDNTASASTPTRLTAATSRWRTTSTPEARAAYDRLERSRFAGD